MVRKRFAGKVISSAVAQAKSGIVKINSGMMEMKPRRKASEGVLERDAAEMYF